MQPTFPPLALDNKGKQLNIALGAATTALLGHPLLVKVCDAQGVARFPGLPDGPFGLHVAIVGVKNFELNWFTDPVKY